MQRIKSVLKKMTATCLTTFVAFALQAQQDPDSISKQVPHLEEFIYPFKQLNFISPRFDRINFNDGSYYNTYYLRAVVTPSSKKLHIRLDLPVATTNLSGKTVTGLDDISVRAVYILGRYRRWYHGTALKLTMPTSTHSSIGSGAWQLNPAYGVVNIFPGYKGSFTFMADYRFSVGANKYGNSSIGVLGLAPNIDYWGDKIYIGYYPTYTCNIKTGVWSFPFDVEAGYLFAKNWWISAEYIMPMEKHKPFKNEFAFKLRYNILQGRSKS